MSQYIIHRGGDPPPYPHVQIVADGFAVIDSKGEQVTICETVDSALAWTRLMWHGEESVRRNLGRKS